MRNGSETKWWTGSSSTAVTPERLEVGDHGRVGEAGVGPAEVLGNQRVQPGEALDVQLVDHRVAGRHRPGDRPRRRRVADDDAQRHRVRGVLGAGHEVGAGDVVEDRARVVHAAGDRAGVRVEQQLGRVEPLAVGRVPGTVDPVAVALLGVDARHEHVPHAVVRPLHLVVDLGVVGVHQGELDPGGPGGPEREGGAAVDDVRAQHRRVAGHGQQDRHGRLLLLRPRQTPVGRPRSPDQDRSACSSCLVRWPGVTGRDQNVRLEAVVYPQTRAGKPATGGFAETPQRIEPLWTSDPAQANVPGPACLRERRRQPYVPRSPLLAGMVALTLQKPVTEPAPDGGAR